jgi:CheY-like chemotaxis protein
MARILLIDDNLEILQMFQRMLEQAGHQVSAGCDGVEGLDLFKKERADLVITDLLMPVKDGLETIQDIRKISTDVPIIAISGNGMTAGGDPLPSAEKLGASLVLSKPFTFADLLDAVSDLLNA